MTRCPDCYERVVLLVHHFRATPSGEPKHVCSVCLKCSEARVAVLQAGERLAAERSQA